MRTAITLALAATLLTTPARAENQGPETPAEVVEAEAAPPPAEPAAEKPAPRPLELRPNRPNEVGSGGGFSIGLKLLAVAAVFAGAFLLFRRGQTVKAARVAGAAPRIVSRTAVGMRNELLVVEVEGQRLLIGVTPSAMSTLSVITEEPRELIEEPKRLSEEINLHRPAIVPPSPKPPTIEESLSRLIAGARAELEEPTPLRKTPAPRAATRKQPDRGEVEDRPSEKRVQRVRDVAGLEGQVRGLSAKRG